MYEDYNCYHYKTDIILGVSEPRYSAEELRRFEERDKRGYKIGDIEKDGYGWSQSMRAIEADIRKSKDEINALSAFGGNEVKIKELKSRIKTFQSKYDEISDVTGIAKEKRRLTVQKPQNVLTNNLSGDIINKKLSDRAINIHNETQNGVFSFEDIEKDLQNSKIGKEIVKYIEDEGLFITMNYDANVPTNVMGQIRGKDIEIFVTNCESLEDAVDTLIHETVHKKYNWIYTQADEINCYIMEYKHRYGEIKQKDLKKIIDFVTENYGHLPKGDFNGFGIY